MKDLLLPWFAIPLLLVLVSLVWLVLRSQRRGAAASTAEKPWLARPEWAGNRIRSTRHAELVFAWLFALVWSGISVPLVVLQFPDLLQREGALAWVLLLFPLGSLVLLAWAVRITRDARRYGEAVLVLDPFPGAIGGDVGGSIALPLAFDPALRFPVTLSCIHHSSKHRGRSREARERLVWQGEGMAQVQRTANGLSLAFRFRVPADLPVSQPRSADHHVWRLDVVSENAEIVFSRRYELPVFATGAQSSLSLDDASNHPQMQQRQQRQIDAVSDIERIPGGVRITLPYGRNPGNAAMALAFGLGFGGAGVASGFLGAPWLFPLIFGGIGAAAVLAALYGLTNSLRVSVDTRGIASERRVLGFVAMRHQAEREQIRQLRLKESYRTQTSGRHKVTYRVVAELDSGKLLTLVNSLQGQEAAEAMLEELGRLTGLPVHQAGVKADTRP
ncbi:MAG: hypothetical protein QM776_01695 [Rhodocyclaceae bacterium]